MLDLYASIKNSLRAIETSLRVSVANANNFNTPGYKFTTTSFVNIFGQVLTPATATTNPQALGGSMTVGSTTTDFSQGSIGFGGALDVAVSGEGFIIISQSAAAFGVSSIKSYTRNGKFQTDFSNTYVTDSFGRKVFGFELNANGNVKSKTLVPIETKGNTDVGFTENGVLVTNFKAHKEAVKRGDATLPERIPLFKMAITTFANKQGLTLTDGGALNPTAASGEAFPPEEAGEGIMGTIIPEAIESSNVEVSRVALDMNLINRGISAIQGITQDVNKMTSDLISKLTA